MPTLAPEEESVYTIRIYAASETDVNNHVLTRTDTVLAEYPLILLRNTYAFKEINAWKSGTTDVGDNYVISPMIGAGKKNADNKFTGVIMGTTSEFPSTGLYGFQNGIATFGFKEDGSCFLGANEETGRIEFNNSLLSLKNVGLSLDGYRLIGTTAISSAMEFDIKNKDFITFSSIVPSHRDAD
jgi:hypothetical protein